MKRSNDVFALFSTSKAGKQRVSVYIKPPANNELLGEEILAKTQ